MSIVTSNRAMAKKQNTGGETVYSHRGSAETYSRHLLILVGEIPVNSGISATRNTPSWKDRVCAYLSKLAPEVIGSQDSPLSSLLTALKSRLEYETKYKKELLCVQSQIPPTHSNETPLAFLNRAKQAGFSMKKPYCEKSMSNLLMAAIMSVGGTPSKQASAEEASATRPLRFHPSRTLPPMELPVKCDLPAAALASLSVARSSGGAVCARLAIKTVSGHTRAIGRTLGGLGGSTAYDAMAIHEMVTAPTPTPTTKEADASRLLRQEEAPLRFQVTRLFSHLLRLQKELDEEKTLRLSVVQALSTELAAEKTLRAACEQKLRRDEETATAGLLHLTQSKRSPLVAKSRSGKRKRGKQ